jgi:long-chain acyl-CoA synthetase
VPLSQALGIIEVGLPFLNVDAPREKPDSIGRPLPDFEIELRNEKGLPVSCGEIGELFLRGPGMLDAYLTPWRLRAEIFEKGWFRTGDLAVEDTEGLIRLAGRSQSVINVAGMKCFPEEIELVLCAQPEIRAARVVAKPHPKFGAVPVAELVARDPLNPPSIAAVVSHCRNSLARFKIPVEFRFVESLPLTPSGKIRR